MAQFTVTLTLEEGSNGFVKIVKSDCVRKEVNEFDTVQVVAAASNGKEYKIVGSKGKVFFFDVEQDTTKKENAPF